MSPSPTHQVQRGAPRPACVSARLSWVLDLESAFPALRRNEGQRSTQVREAGGGREPRGHKKVGGKQPTQDLLASELGERQ